MVRIFGKVQAGGPVLATLVLLVPALACALASRPASSGLFVRAVQSPPPGRSVPARQSAAARVPDPAPKGCTGINYQVIPARGDIGNPAGTESGHFWWAITGTHVVCIGTIKMWVHYPKLEYVHWLVGVYEHHALREFIGAQNDTLGPGWYYWDFPVHEEFQSVDSLCLLAAFGTSPDGPADISCARLG